MEEMMATQSTNKPMHTSCFSLQLSVMCVVYMVTVLEGTTVLVTMVGVVHVVSPPLLNK